MVYVTNKCNRRCKDCFVEFGTYEISIPEAHKIVKCSGSVDKLYISGGEPTIHSNFREVVEILSEIDSNEMILVTNGYKLSKYTDVLKVFSCIRISDYGDNNIEISDSYNGRVRMVNMETMLDKSIGVGACGRSSNGLASVYRGLVYGCCVAAGIAGAEGLEFDENWRKVAGKTVLPCSDCIFAV